VGAISNANSNESPPDANGTCKIDGNQRYSRIKNQRDGAKHSSAIMVR
jgi:hypothetical protein